MSVESNLERDCQTEGTYHYQTRADQSPSEAVIQAVASVSGRSPAPLNDIDGDNALDPLYEAINPDALDTLFDLVTESSHPVGSVEFLYCGCEVTVESSGLVTVTET